MKALEIMMKNWLAFLWTLLIDEVGEVDDEENNDQDDNENPEDDGQSDDDPKTGSHADPEDDGDGEENNNDDAKKQFGGYESIEELIEAHESIKGQAGATEGNLRKLRGALKKHGIVYDSESDALALMPGQNENENGQVSQKKSRQPRFTDEHREKFAKFFSSDDDDKEVITATRDEFLNLMSTLVEDRVEEMLLNFQEKSSSRMKQQMQFRKEQQKSFDTMFTSFPQLKQGAEGFDKEFHDQALDLYNSSPDLQRLPDGQLIAAERTARQLSISPVQLGKARKEGYNKGKEGKRIVSSVSGKQSKSSGQFKRLSENEYLALTQEERDKYNKQLLGIE